MGEKYALILNEILEKNQHLLNAISLDEMNLKPKPDKWSKKETLGHLIDSAYNNHQRLIRAEKKTNLIFDGYDQNAWVRKNNYQNRDSQEVVSLFIAVNQHIASLISQLKDEELEATTVEHNFDAISMNTIEKGKPSSLAYLIEDYIFHLNHHLKQILSFRT